MTAMYKGEQYSCALRADQRVKVSHTPRQQLIPLQVKGDFLPILSFCSTHIGSHSVKHTPDQVITLNRQKMFQNQNPLQIRKQLCSLCPSGLFSFNNTGMIPFFPSFCCTYSTQCSMLHRSTYIRRESSLGSLMQIIKNKYILPLAVKGTQGCFSFKLDNSFNSSSHQISPVNARTSPNRNTYLQNH